MQSKPFYQIHRFVQVGAYYQDGLPVIFYIFISIMSLFSWEFKFTQEIIALLG